MRWLLLVLLLSTGLTVAAEEPLLAVIVSSAHAKELSREDLTLVFKRKKLFWNDGSKIQPINLPASNPLRRTFSLAVLKATPEDLEKYWNDLYFHGITPPFVGSSEEAVLRYVAETPGAIGYISVCHADSRVAISQVINAAGHVVEDATSYACPR